jgi:acyl carrier protein
MPILPTLPILPQLITFISAIAEVPAGAITPETTPSQLAMDSLAMVELTVNAEAEFGITLETGELLAEHTVAKMAAHIDAKRAVSV